MTLFSRCPFKHLEQCGKCGNRKKKLSKEIEKNERKKNGGGGSGGCQKHTERFDVWDKCVCAHVHMPWFNVHPSVCFFSAALQVQRPAAALPRMPGGWIIPPSPHSHPLYSSQERLLKHMESITAREEGGTRKEEEGHRSWQRWIWQKLEKWSWAVLGRGAHSSGGKDTAGRVAWHPRMENLLGFMSLGESP